MNVKCCECGQERYELNGVCDACLHYKSKLLTSHNIDANRIIYQVLDAVGLWHIWYNATEEQQIAIHDALLDAVRSELAQSHPA